MTIKDAIQLLELSAPFSKAALKKAYRDALMVWHPDRFTGNTELKAKAENRTYQINEAYALLSRIPESEYPYRASVEGQQTKQTPSSNPQRANADPPSRPQPQPPRRQSSSPPQRTGGPTQPPMHEQFKNQVPFSVPSGWSLKRLDSLLNSPRAVRVYSTMAWIMVTPFVVWLLVSTLIRWNRESDQRYAANIYTAPTPPSNSTLTPEFKTPSAAEILDSIRMDNKIQELQRHSKERAKGLDKLMRPFDFSLPPTQLKAEAALKHLASDERLTSGSILTDHLTPLDGKGKLTLDNGLTEDAFVKILSDDRLVSSFYVRGREKFTFGHIPDGVYRLIYCTGFGWDAARRDFERGRHAMRYDEALDFTTTRRTEGNSIITSTGVITLTLHKVANGNARTSDIPLKEFDRY